LKKLILSLFLLLPACQRPAGDRPAGHSYLVGYGCLTCHRVGREGGNVGPDLTFVGFRKSPEWMRDFIRNPHAWKPDTQMPNFRLSDEVLDKIVDYLSTLKGQAYLEGESPWNTAALKEDPVKRGEAIYNRVGCTGCHGPAGVGGYKNNNVVGGKIPSLKLVADGYSKEELKERVAKGVKPEKEDPAGPDPMIQMPAWEEKLKSDELDALVEYLYSLRPPLSAEDAW
jgi:mono/diheme cytochrome c family protein